MRFAHVNLIARDWRILADFYSSVLGCTLVPPERDYHGPDLAVGTGLSGARLQGVHLRLPGNSDDGPTLEIYSYDDTAEGPRPEVNRPGFGHIAFAVEDVAVARARVIAGGGCTVGQIVDSHTSAGTTVRWCYCRDPEGNIIELQRWLEPPTREPMPGYSGKPLYQKLGLKPPMRLLCIDAPGDYESWLGGLPEGVEIGSDGEVDAAVHLFVTERTVLERKLPVLREELVPTGMLWVSWPKKSSRVPTDVTEDVIREVALPLGFVDVKVCAVSDVWSALKLVIRKSERHQ